MRNPNSFTVTKTKKKRNTKPRKMSLKKLISTSKPAKHLTGESSKTQKHNTIYACCPTQAIIQGTANNQRVGDSAYLCSLKLRVNLQAWTDPNGYQFRVIIGWTGEELTTANIATEIVSGGIGSTELFLPNTTTYWMGNALINPKAFTVLFDRVYDVNSQISGYSDVVSDIITVPLNTQFEYQSSGNVQGKTRNLVIAVVGGVCGGIAGTTNVGNVVAAWDLVFKS